MILPLGALPAIPLEEFVKGAGSGSRLGERLEVVGSLLSLPTILVVVGVTIFLAVVFRGSIGEQRALIWLCLWCALIALGGSILQTYGAFAVLGSDWSDVTTESRLWAPVMRWIFGGFVAAGYAAELIALEGRASNDDRWAPGVGAALGFVGVVLGAFSFAFDGHTVSRGPRLAHALLDGVHVVAGSVWLGGMVALVTLAWWRRARVAPPVSPLIVRFSSVAAVALLAVAAAGGAMSLLIVDGAGDYVTTTWGRVLLAKVGLVVLAAAIGTYNHFVVVPALGTDPDDATAGHRARTTLTVEAMVLVSVALLTVFLTIASTE